ncbi:Tic22 family protein [Pantanalinema rosaneae CENA516]|uniref:Tic22 family protein n=1 Tax=Pantanalinema rosaneae TaxID=1620701 RepID=UPI003D700193
MSGAVMKSLIRLGATASLVGSAVIGSLWFGATQVLALTQEQIMKKLGPVPVFTIANPQGAPLVAAPNGQNGQSVAGVFISQKDAQAFLDGLKTKNPELAKGVKVVPVSLAEVYKLDQDNQGKPQGLDFAYVPSQQQVNSAVALLKQSGQQVQQFNGTPLFVARGGAEKGYLTIQQGNQSVIPMFFKKEELQSLLDRFKQQQPNLANSLEIQVLNLEGLMEVLKTKNDPQLDQIVLIPPQESIEFVRSMMGNQPGQARPQPAQQQAPKR